MLSSFSYGAKVKLDELSRIMGLPGKPGGMDGSQVEAYFNAGRIQEIADYCKSDVINTYRLWLRHELFRGRLDQNQFEFSERDVGRLVDAARIERSGDVRCWGQSGSHLLTVSISEFDPERTDGSPCRPLRTFARTVALTMPHTASLN